MSLLKKSVATLIMVAACNTAYADSFAERESLSRLLHELDTVSLLSEEAGSHANPDSRIKFQYRVLRKDLARIRIGIQDHLDSPTIEPRHYEPLSGEYRR